MGSEYLTRCNLCLVAQGEDRRISAKVKGHRDKLRQRENKSAKAKKYLLLSTIIEETASSLQTELIQIIALIDKYDMY